MIKKLITGRINSITIAALLVALSSLISRFLGIFRDRILASEFGAGQTLDIYYAAFRVPDMVFNLLVLGALSAGFIPIFSKLLDKPFDKFKSEEEKEAWMFASDALNILFFSITLLSLLGIIFSNQLMGIIAPGFSPEQKLLTAKLTRIMFLSPIFLGVSSVFGGILQSVKRFFVYSLSPILYNIGIILGALFLAPLYGVNGLAWGVVIGAFMHMVVQIPLILKLGFSYHLSFNFRSKNIKEIFRLMIPRTMSLAISQINLVVITIIASTLAAGSLTVFNFANNLQFFPISIFGISFAVAAFPAFSQVAFDKKELTKQLSYTLRQILFFIVPSTVLLLTLRAQIVRVVFGAGEFNWNDTRLTMETLAIFSMSLFAQSVIPLLVRVYYARHNAKTPFLIGLFCAFVNVLFSLYFSNTMGVLGLALAYSISSIINFVLLWIFLKLEIGNLDEDKVFVSVVKMSAAALICGTVTQYAKGMVEPFVDMEKLWGVLTQGAISGIFGLIFYIFVNAILKSEELDYLWSAIKRRMPWKKINSGDHGEARGI